MVKGYAGLGIEERSILKEWKRIQRNERFEKEMNRQMPNFENDGTHDKDRNKDFFEEEFLDPNEKVIVEGLDSDPVNHPSHYTNNYSGLETLDAIKTQMRNAEQYKGYLIGNITKYVGRADLKGKELEDLNKAKFYLDELISVVEEERYDN